MNDRALIPGNRQLSATSGVAVPVVIRDAGPDAIRRFVEFFTAEIRNPNTRAAYMRAVRRFCTWAERHRVSLAQVEPVLVAAYKHRQPVLITGEHGAGKEFTARLIHRLSRDSSTTRFLKVSAATLTVEFLNAMLANVPEKPPSDTVFLDGLEQMPADVQSRLADLLLARSSLAIAESASCRLLAASSEDLAAAVSAGWFLNELYCALSVTEIAVPPLRERRGDIPDLCSEVLRSICQREHRVSTAVDASDIPLLLKHPWPGNVRQLRQILEAAVWESETDRLILPESFHVPASDGGHEAAPYVSADELKRQERANVLACLKQCRWKVYGNGGAAEKLGMKPTTLLYRMKVLGIHKPKR